MPALDTLKHLYQLAKNQFRCGFFDRPTHLGFTVEYYHNPSVWTDIYADLPPVCVRNKQREVVEVHLDPDFTPLNPRGRAVVIPVCSEQFGYSLSGRGYLEVAVRNPLGGDLELVWAFEIGAARFVPPDEIRRTTVPVHFTHSVAGKTVKVSGAFEIENGRIRSKHLVLNYNNFAVAKVTLTEAAQFGPSVLAG